MTAFVNETLTDIRRGRQSWRVLVTFCLPSFVVSVATSLLLHVR
ncbi:MAG TPA: hypothetical protein VF824_18205 [Thermoanaerobaculia bacterium]|jgi:hypothetical protein